ncbi:Ig-like domain repeat protein [Candidatus Soleaferrea massiliensis]|uniref:Ig-like domain repeat protein n=1 Tax=Candidatus Soleaferrea massiliensis TaxID=1470354 RepID=UPI0018CC9578|nr:Ig-like domain repeat protein [Candidatus Soleaferrea massiliensis]
MGRMLRVRTGKRVLAVLLSIVMLFGMLPATAFAQDTQDQRAFTITVTDQATGQAVEQARVRYTISCTGRADATGSAVTNAQGIAVVEEMTGFAFEPLSEVSISCSAEKDGYHTAELSKEKITAFDGNVTVPVTAVVQKKVTISQTGRGEVRIDGELYENGGEIQIRQGSRTTVSITPKAGSYIKTLSIDGKTAAVKKYESYEHTYTVDDDMEVVVAFQEEAAVTLQKNAGGTVLMNDTQTDVLKIDKHETVKLEVRAEEGYQIKTVSIGGVTQPIDVPGIFAGSFRAETDTTVMVEFIRVYKVTVTVGKNGEVHTDPACEAGSVLLKDQTMFHIKAVPNSNYRVSEVRINGKPTGFEENDYIYEKEFKIGQPYEFVVTFALNRYQVAVSQEGEGGIAYPGGQDAGTFLAEYGSEPVLEIAQKDGFYLESLLLDGNNVIEDAAEDASRNNTYTYKLPKVTSDTKVHAVFKKIPVSDPGSDPLTSDKYTISFDKEILRRYTEGDTHVVVLPAGTQITIAPSGAYAFIKLNGMDVQKKLIVRDATTEIDSITLSKGLMGYRDPTRIDVKLKLAVDTQAPKLAVDAPKANQHGYYNGNVTVSVRAEDQAPYSGIKSIQYRVTSGEDGEITQEGKLYSSESGGKEQAVGREIVVDKDKNNSDHVTVYVEAKDFAGNVVSNETDPLTLKINSSKPQVSVSITQERQAYADGCYGVPREAVVTIRDRASTFDEAAATGSVRIAARDQKGRPVELNLASMIGKWTSDGDEHRAVVRFYAEAYYDWSVAYENKAGLSNPEPDVSGDDAFAFCIDRTEPTASLSLEADFWDQVIETLTFGIWKNHPVTVTAKADDTLSGVNEVAYCKSNETAVLTWERLEELYQEGRFQTQPYTMDTDELFVIYARVSDNAGNTRYVSTDGVIVDMTASKIDLRYDEPNEHGFYGDDVNMEIEVNDAQPYSGIRRIDCQITCDGRVTSTETLYTFDKKNPTFQELEHVWSGAVTVDSEENDGDQVCVTVTATDNAGNVSEESAVLSISAVPPSVSVDFEDEAVTVVGDKGYYALERTAVVTVTNRESVFDAQKATQGIDITAVDAEGAPVALDLDAMIGDWTTEGDIHTVQVRFLQDANYTWSISYTDKAGHSPAKIQADSGDTPFYFAVDRTAPSGGVIEISERIWDQLLEVLTFGLYSSDGYDVSYAAGEDETSPVILEYYKTDNPLAMTAQQLDEVEFEPFEPFRVEQDEQFVVYLKITDYAGNYTYVSSNGYIVDKQPSIITLHPGEPNENGVYSGDVTVGVSVHEEAPYSGIKQVEYWVECDGEETQRELLFDFDIENPAQAQLQQDFSRDITVKADLNNSCEVVLHVRSTDNAGNESYSEEELDIDITPPEITVSYDNNDAHKIVGDRGYFDRQRTATVVITERSHHFSPEDAAGGIRIAAADGNGAQIEIDRDAVISEWKTAEGGSPDEAKHTAVIRYEADANYRFDISYADLAGNQNDGVSYGNSAAPTAFTVDQNRPTGHIKAKAQEGWERRWESLTEPLLFGLFSNRGITITGDANDLTSPLETIQYYKTADTAAKKTSELDAVKEWRDFSSLNIKPNEQFSVYLKLVDYAGNVTYISTDGMIVDNTKPREETIAPEVTIRPPQPVNGIYSRDVKVDIKVTDPVAGNTCSGLKRVRYEVLNMGKTTQSGNLFVFDNPAPGRDQLRESWTGSITVDKTRNNSNDVVIRVFAEDNAGNASQEQTTIKIDTTAPQIDISYDNNNADSGKYFKENRTATIVVTERNFNPKDVRLTITNTDGPVPAISSWSRTAGTGNLDNTKWTATITYAADGDYRFAISYADQAGNVCSGERYRNGTAAPTDFTIDKTVPTIRVAYDNNAVQNGSYYNAARTATVTIREHNFDESRINIELTAVNDGADAARPSVSGWRESGDDHIATITYAGDALYTFDISYTDKAGNRAADFERQSFYVDRTAPELSISGVEDRSANKGDVIPVVSYTDTNFDVNEVRITLKGAGRGEVELDGSYAAVQNGQTFTFRNFVKEKYVDDIYTLEASLTDRAGNTTTKQVVFSVNRFGSTYALMTEKLNGSFTRAPVDVVVTETNPNELVNIRITLFKNDKTLVLREGEQYRIDVEGGNDSWYKYTYTIFKSNFEDDGVYRLSIHSEDAAGNVAENTLETKDKEISFGIDKTPPNLVVANLEDGVTYPVESLSVLLSAQDNLKLDSVAVYLDGEENRTWSSGDIETMEAQKEDFIFEIPGNSTKAHAVRVVSMDAAGNETVAEIWNFYVTTNLWVRYFNNKALFFGSIGGFVLLAGLGVVLAVVRKRKHADGQDRIS